MRDPSESFHLDPKTGKLKMKDSKAFDREKLSHFELEVSTVEVKPTVIKDPEILNSNKIKIQINVDDDNDNSPVFLPSKSSPFFILHHLRLKMHFILAPRKIRTKRQKFWWTEE